MRVLLLLLILLSPVTALAALFDVPSTDRSMQYLGMIFGPITGLPITGQGNNLVGGIMMIFNEIVFALGIILIAYTGFVGAVNTAHEGKFLGEKWHPVLVPVRVGVGMYLLLPSASGYNWIQVAVMWFIVQGVGAANALWTQIMVFNQQGGQFNQDTRIMDLSNSMDAVIDIMSLDACMIGLNNNSEYIKRGYEPVSVYRSIDGKRVEWGRLTEQGKESPLCGFITLPEIGTNSLNISGQADPGVAARKRILGDAIVSVAGGLEPSVFEMLNMPSSQWQFGSGITSASQRLVSAVKSMDFTFSSLKDTQKRAVVDGWIHAGSYYTQIVAGGSQQDITVKVDASPANSAQIEKLIGLTEMTAVNSKTAATLMSYIQHQIVFGIILPQPGSSTKQLMKSNPLGGTGDVQALWNLLFGSYFDDLAEKLEKKMTTGGALGDPILSMSNFGQDLMMGVELTFWVALGVIFIAWLTTGSLSCVNPLPHTMDYVLMVMMPIVTAIIVMLWGAGVTLGMYVPLIPYLVFSFAAIGWMVLVIEAMLGAPLIALTLLIPSEDEIGKAGHAIIILLGLFLRPALMIMGFVLGIKLLNVAISMLNFGFMSTMVASTGGGAQIGIFGLIAVIIMYTGIATTMVHEGFSLIYKLPNQILRWLSGGGAEGDDKQIQGQMQGMKGAADKGGAMGAGAMKGGLATSQKAVSKGKSGGGGGGLSA